MSVWPGPAEPIEPVLRAQGLGKSYMTRRPLSRRRLAVRAFSGVNLGIPRGCTLVIIGQSGAGKSTLARCLALLERPTEGRILLDGHDALALPRHELFRARRKIQLIFQDFTSALNPRLSLLDLIGEPLRIQHQGTPTEQRRAVLRLMDQVALPANCERRRALELSGGQRERAVIARALALDPELLILDECLAALDPINQGRILALLAGLRRERNLTYVFVAHDLRVLAGFATHVAVMAAGELVEQNDAAALFARPAHDATRALLAAMPPVEAICAARGAGRRDGAQP